MYGVRKKFSKDLHDCHDPKSRKVVKEFLKKQGIVVNDNTNKKGVDLISDDGTLQLELEHRPPWNSHDFPYSEVNILERKKYLGEGKIQYIILSRDFSRLGIISGDVIKKYIIDDNLKHNPNKNVWRDEYVYKVPATEFKWIKI